MVIPEPLARPMPMRSVREAIPLVRLFGLFVAGLVLLLACMNVAASRRWPWARRGGGSSVKW